LLVNDGGGPPRAARRAARPIPRPEQGGSMLWTIFLILLVMWLLGMVTSYTLNGFIHILLVVALVVLLLNVISGRRPVI